MFLCALGPGEGNASGVQVSRRVGVLHHQNLLDHAPQVPSAGIHSQGQVQPGHTRGAGASQPQQAPHLPEDQETPLLPKAPGHGAGLHREVAQLLRGRPADRQHGDAGAPVQQDGPAAQQLRPDVLRPRIQHAPVLARVAVQLQVPVVLLRPLQHLQWEDRGVYL